MANFVFKLCLVAVVMLIGFCAVPSVNGNCTDKRSDCHSYADSSCEAPYKGWAYQNCRKRCNMCQESHCVAVTCWEWPLDNGCYLSPPGPGKCCDTIKCPSNVKIHYPPGYKEE